jgi:hypothetical protein
MSPHHKNVVPRMAAQYGFDYEFVTYKWPAFLNKQTDKQRIIWAYKILFLDVLFPLDVDRVIFVDSDQVGGLLRGAGVTVHVAGAGCRVSVAVLTAPRFTHSQRPWPVPCQGV